LGGEKTTEITFRLPGIRIEHICVGKYDIIGLTCVTPQEDNKTCITQIFYWNIPVLSLLKPFARPLIKRFLKQDGDMMALQTANLPYNPVMTLIDDADTQAKWYYKLCREWIASQNENRIFENPVTAKTLEWKS
jgi:hypothetical protein